MVLIVNTFLAFHVIGSITIDISRYIMKGYLYCPRHSNKCFVTQMPIAVPIFRAFVH